MYYVAVDIGCIECGENSHVLGIFTDKKEAEKVCDIHEEQSKNCIGQHNFEVYEIKEINKVYPIKYRDSFDWGWLDE